MTEAEFRRAVLTPYWCAGSPFEWEARTVFGQRVGIAGLARDVEIGKFNLCWWLLDRDFPPLSPETYQLAPMQWALRTAPTLTLNGRPLPDIAAMMPLTAFNSRISKLLDGLPVSGYAMLEAYGVTVPMLRHLASRSVSAA